MQKRNVIKNVCLIVILSIAVAVGLNCLLLFADIAQYSERYQEATVVLYSPPFIQQILYSGILIPILEELLFRGLMFRLLRRWIAFPWAMVFSAVVFGAYHGNIVQFIYATICGVLLAYLCEKYDSIIAPVLSHMMMNLVSIILTEAGVFAWVMDSGVKVLFVVAFCVATGVFALYMLQKMDVTKVLKIYCKDMGNDI